MTDTTVIRDTPADWYPDPTDDSQWRWWSGAAWTEHVSARVVVPAPAVAFAPAAVHPPAVEYRPVAADVAAVASAGPVAVAPSAPVEAAFDWHIPPAAESTDSSRAGSGAAQPTARAWVAPATPASTATPFVWIVAAISVIATLCQLGARQVLGAGSGFAFAALGLIILPLLAYVVGVVGDRRRLKAAGFERPASTAWAILGPLPYLIARGIRLRGQGARVWTPLWVFLASSIATVVVLAGLIAAGLVSLDEDSSVVSAGDTSVPTTTLSLTDQIEQQLQAEVLAAGATTVTIDCPATADLSPGATFSCTSVDSAAPATPGSVVVVMNPDGAGFTYTAG